jgi:hypothetical protein
MSEKKFECYWGHGYENSPFTRTKTEKSFTPSQGYTKRDTEKILALEIGEVWQAQTNEVHIVTRIA